MGDFLFRAAPGGCQAGVGSARSPAARARQQARNAHSHLGIVLLPRQKRNCLWQWPVAKICLPPCARTEGGEARHCGLSSGLLLPPLPEP